MTDFATIGIIPFYDIGLTLEWLGLPYEPIFSSCIGSVRDSYTFEYVSIGAASAI